jgi:hypothetical protein
MLKAGAKTGTKVKYETKDSRSLILITRLIYIGPGWHLSGVDCRFYVQPALGAYVTTFLITPANG